jgi:hypothetical protein
MVLSDRQALATLGPAGVDNGAPTAGLHADQETVGAGASDFGGLISAFHICISVDSPRTHSGKPSIIANFLRPGNTLLCGPGAMRELLVADAAAI